MGGFLLAILAIVMLFPLGFMIWMSVTGKRVSSPSDDEVEVEEVDFEAEEVDNQP